LLGDVGIRPEAVRAQGLHISPVKALVEAHRVVTRLRMQSGDRLERAVLAVEKKRWQTHERSDQNKQDDEVARLVHSSIRERHGEGALRVVRCNCKRRQWVNAQW